MTLQPTYNSNTANRYFASPSFRLNAAALAVAGCAGIAIGYDVRAVALVLAFVLVIFAGVSRLFTTVLLAALFLPFQRLLAVDLGPFNLKISQIIFIMIMMKLFASKLVARDERLKIARFTLPVFVFCVWNTVTAIWSPEPVYSFALAMWAWFSLFLSHCVINLAVTRQRVELLVRYMIYGGIVASAFGLYQFVAEYTGLPSFLREGYTAREGYIARVQSTALEPLHYASFLMTIIPLCLACYICKQRMIGNRFLKCSLVLMIMNLVLTVSRGGYIGLVVAALIVWRCIGHEHKDSANVRSFFRVMVVVGTLCVLLAAALSLGSIVDSTFSEGGSKRAGSTMDRIMQYYVALRMIREKPLTGTGIGSYSYYYWGGSAGPNRQYANSVPLEVAAETGIIGLACLGWFTFSVFRMLRQAVRQSRDPFEHAVAVGLLATAASLMLQYLTVSPFYAEWTWFALGLAGALSNLVISGTKTRPGSLEDMP